MMDEEEEEYIPMSSPDRDDEERERREAQIFRTDIMRGIALTEHSMDDDSYYATPMDDRDPIDWLTADMRRAEIENMLLGSSHYDHRGKLLQERDIPPIGEEVSLPSPSAADPESLGGSGRRNQRNRARKVAATAMNGGTSADLLAFLRLQHSGELVADNQPIETIPQKEHLSNEHMQMLINWQTTSNARRTKLDTGACVVCESDKAGYHFGVTACAACSAFFRRTISERRKYVCRKTGPDHLKCPIDKRHRCYCRACRLQKCLAQGMDPNAVQPHRDSIGAKPPRTSRSPAPTEFSETGLSHNNNNNNELFMAKPESMRPDSSLGICATTLLRASPEMVVPKEETEEGYPLDSLDDPSAPESVIDRPSSAFSNSSDGSPYDPHQNIIEIMVEQYSKLVERRRLVYCPSSIHAILSGTPPMSRPAKMFDRVRRHHIRIEIGLFVEFLNCIHPFPKLSLDDKVALMKHLSVSFSILEKYYATMRGGGLDTNRIIHSDGTYTDLDNLSSNEFDTNEASGQKTDRETLNKLFITPLRDALREISGPMFHYNMTDVEFCALTAILLFDPSAVGLMDATRRLVKDARDRVYQDWFSYYRAHGVSDACQRVGNTMLLLPAVQTTVEKTAENFTLIRIFELFEYDKILDDLFSKDSTQFSSDIPPPSDLDS